MTNVTFRQAKQHDIHSILGLIWDDQLRQSDSEKPVLDDEKYLLFFQRIDGDPNQFLLVGENENKEIVATAHLTTLHYLPFFDTRIQVEYVRVAKHCQGLGVGRQMFDFIEAKARAMSASRVQLTTDKRRESAKYFYESLGYTATHEGMKLFLK